MDLLKLTALELGEKIKAKEVTVREAVDAVIGQIKEAESEIHSFVTIDEEGAYAQAEEIQKKIDVGELTGPLAGVPVAVKDNMCIEGQITTCSSRFFPTSNRPIRQRQLRTSEKQERLSLVRQTWMNLPWEVQQRRLITDRHAIRTTQRMFREVLPVVPVRQWQRPNVIMHLDLIPADPFVSRVLSVELSD